MSLVAKVFIVINLVLSLVLISFTSILLAQQSDFKVKLLEKRRDTDAIKRERARVAADFELQIQNVFALTKDITAQHNRKVQEAQGLETEIQSLKNDADRLSKELEILDGAQKAEDKILRDTKARKAEADGKVAEMKRRLEEAQAALTEWTAKLQEEEAKLRGLRSQLEGGGS